MHRAESVLQNCVMGRCAICIFMYCYNWEGLSYLRLHEEGLKEWETQIYLSVSSVSAGPGILHDLWVVRAVPCLWGWSLGHSIGHLAAQMASSMSGKAQTGSRLVGLVPSAGSKQLGTVCCTTSGGQLSILSWQGSQLALIILTASYWHLPPGQGQQSSQTSSAVFRDT